MKPHKSSPRSFRPYPESLRIAEEVTKNTKLSQKDIFALVLDAGLAAIEANHYEFSMPLRFNLEISKLGNRNDAPRSVKAAAKQS